MASQPITNPQSRPLEIPAELRQSLHLRETETHYLVQTLSGATIFFAKSEIEYPSELTCGILDDRKDTGEERRREREWELAHDERKFGAKQDD